MSTQAASLTAAKPEQPTATLGVAYRYSKPKMRFEKLTYDNDDMMLMISPEASRFYSLKTQFYDSLATSPGGMDIINKLKEDAVAKSVNIERDASGNITSITVNTTGIDMPGRGEPMSVVKYPAQGVMQVVSIPPYKDDDGYYTYEVAMDELEWEPGDSVKTILDYECQMATADYHGRKWTAWYTPDIPVADGPWQLAGLPGLILLAYSDGKEYVFTATGIEQLNEPLSTLPGDPALEKTTRKEFLRLCAEINKNPDRNLGAGVKVVSKLPPVYHDLIEIDYEEK